ncbi:integral membrane protein [Paecilomyces variotii No. 5]|uniref:Integral membrane protein n=1 Tax=Byssochlamys spectabilis (strain No. 5 / NBRC 109023) TaxID=1356009 RepID=V5FCK4_BYSSN|nr:integral membrane protein [Paecilomyces variotii No. 5]
MVVKLSLAGPVMLSVDCIMIVLSEVASIRRGTHLTVKFESLVTRLRMRLEQTTCVRAIVVMYNFVLPPTQVPPILRILCCWFVCVCIYPFALYSAHYACGLKEGILSRNAELSLHCMEIYSTYDSLPYWTRHQRADSSFCFGEEAGLELQACLQDIVNTLTNFMESSLLSTPLAALVASCLACLFSLLHSIWTAKPTPSISTDSSASLYAVRAAEISALRSAKDKLGVQIAQLNGELRITYGRLADANRKYAEMHDKARKADASWISLIKINAGLCANVNWLEERLSKVQDDTVQMLTDQVARLKQQLTSSEESVRNANNELSALRNTLQAQEEELVATERRLQETRDAAEKSALDIQTLAAAKIDEAASDHETLKLSYDKMGERLRVLEYVRQERNNAAGRVIDLQRELESTKRIADEAYKQWMRAMEGAQDRERALSEHLQAVQSAFEEQCRARQEKAVADAMCQAKASATEAFQAEREELRLQLKKAVLDAQTGKQQAQKLKEEVENLQVDLARFGISFGSSQSIPERKVANPSSSLVRGSIKTALEDRDVKIQALEHEVEELRRKPCEGLTDTRLKAVADKLGKDLKAEKAARTNDQLRWHKQLQELQDENRKLRISLSTAESALGRRRISKRDQAEDKMGRNARSKSLNKGVRVCLVSLFFGVDEDRITSSGPIELHYVLF